MNKISELSPQDAKRFILEKQKGSIEVRGLLDLRGVDIEEIVCEISCFDLDASESNLKGLPSGIQIKSRLILDNCPQFESLPQDLKCGSMSLRNCKYLKCLPENLDTWFLDLTDCTGFENWPQNATIHRGIVRLRNCVNIQSLPGWFTRLGQLDVAGCVQLLCIPDGMEISGWLDIGGTNISELPPSLENVALRWRGVRIDERIAFRPESITAKQILKEPNAELRRVMIERVGFLKFAQEANAKVLDSDSDPGGERELLRIELDEDEPLVGLTCYCPSTGRHYFLRVPPDMKSCHQAAAWMAGFDDPKRYKPDIET